MFVRRNHEFSAISAIVAAACTSSVHASHGSLLVPGSAAWAQVPNPPADGSMPGAELVTTVLGWLKWGGLAAALAGLLIGAIAIGVGHFGSNYYSASSAGRKWLLGGMGSAILSGLA